jgi:hypothetical protein
MSQVALVLPGGYMAVTVATEGRLPGWAPRRSWVGHPAAVSTRHTWSHVLLQRTNSARIRGDRIFVVTDRGAQTGIIVTSLADEPPVRDPNKKSGC